MYEKKQIKKKTKIVVSYPVPIAAWSGSDASRSAGVIREWGFAVPTPVGHVGCVCPASSATRRARSGCRRRGMPLARASAGLSGSELQVAPRSAVWKPAAGCPALNRASGSELQVVPRSTVWKRAAGCPALNRASGSELQVAPRSTVRLEASCALNRLEASCRLPRAQPSGSQLQVAPRPTVRLEASCRLSRAQPSGSELRLLSSSRCRIRGRVR